MTLTDDLERYVSNLHRWAISQGHLSHVVGDWDLFSKAIKKLCSSAKCSSFVSYLLKSSLGFFSETEPRLRQGSRDTHVPRAEKLNPGNETVRSYNGTDDCTACFKNKVGAYDPAGTCFS